MHTTRKNKSASYGFKAPHESKYPADGYYYGVCDLCGHKMRVKDMKRTYGTRGNLLVCPRDYESPHMHDYLRGIKERPQPKLTRSEAADSFSFIDTVAEIETDVTASPSGRSPGIPRDLKAEPESSTSISLTWSLEDVDPGSGPIKGYKIERESPVSGGFSTVVANTNSVAKYYLNTGLSASTQYNYRISAINDYGTGSASPEANTTTPSS